MARRRWLSPDPDHRKEASVIETRIARPTRTDTPEKIPDYALRGLGIFEVARNRILESYQGGGRWLVPSGSETGRFYEVRVGSRPERHRCECRGFALHRHCSHLVAAERVARRSAVCDCCGSRCWWPELTEVTEDDGLLAWFPGDLLCSSCIPGHWA